MTRYRKIDPRMWGDEKFRALSRLQPSGQALWIYLLTGPHTGLTPGLYSLTLAGVAHRLGWELEALREAFEEAFEEGLAEYDPKAFVLAIPKAFRYDPPGSPNVVKKWVRSSTDIPECELKTKQLLRLKAFLEGMSKAFGEAFEEAFREAYGKGSENLSETSSSSSSSSSSRNRSKEREKRAREQKSKSSLSPTSSDKPKVKTSIPTAGEIIQAEGFSDPPKNTGPDSRPDGHEHAAVMEICEAYRDVWNLDMPPLAPVRDDLVRIRLALRHPAIGLDGCKSAIRGHKKLSTKEGSQLGRDLRHAFPPARHGGKPDSTTLDEARVHEFMRANGGRKRKKNRSVAKSDIEKRKSEDLESVDLARAAGAENLEGPAKFRAILEYQRTGKRADL